MAYRVKFKVVYVAMFIHFVIGIIPELHIHQKCNRSRLTKNISKENVKKLELISLQNDIN